MREAAPHARFRACICALQPSSSLNELTWIYGELANPTEYKADFNDIAHDDSRCAVGWDLCTGVGSARTYVGK